VAAGINSVIVKPAAGFASNAVGELNVVTESNEVDLDFFYTP
jgi:hypothetical protein